MGRPPIEEHAIYIAMLAILKGRSYAVLESTGLEGMRGRPLRFEDDTEEGLEITWEGCDGLLFMADIDQSTAIQVAAALLAWADWNDLIRADREALPPSSGEGE